MNTNSATLCGSCHTQGKYKFTGEEAGRNVCRYEFNP
jgi:hypothetical protein